MMPSIRTLFLSRLIGLYCLLVGLSMMSHKQLMVDGVTALLQNSSLTLLLGFITLCASLAMVLAHNLWWSGPLALIITLIGWLALIKSLLFLFLSPAMEARFFLGQLHYQQFFYDYAAVSIALGIYLTYAGFTSSPH
jgi:vacuolar-type H+-ATPase subunit I/STV1